MPWLMHAASAGSPPARAARPRSPAGRSSGDTVAAVVGTYDPGAGVGPGLGARLPVADAGWGSGAPDWSDDAQPVSARATTRAGAARTGTQRGIGTSSAFGPRRPGSERGAPILPGQCVRTGD